MSNTCVPQVPGAPPGDPSARSLASHHLSSTRQPSVMPRAPSPALSHHVGYFLPVARPGVGARFWPKGYAGMVPPEARAGESRHVPQPRAYDLQRGRRTRTAKALRGGPRGPNPTTDRKGPRPQRPARSLHILRGPAGGSQGPTLRGSAGLFTGAPSVRERSLRTGSGRPVHLRRGGGAGGAQCAGFPRKANKGRGAEHRSRCRGSQGAPGRPPQRAGAARGAGRGLPPPSPEEAPSRRI